MLGVRTSLGCLLKTTEALCLSLCAGIIFHLLKALGKRHKAGRGGTWFNSSTQEADKRSEFQAQLVYTARKTASEKPKTTNQTHCKTHCSQQRHLPQPGALG